MADIDNQEEPTVRIGELYVPEWQFQIYEKESAKFLGILKAETENARHTAIAPALIRAVHTLSGTTNTLGFDHVAKLGHALEYWLNTHTEKHPDTVLSQEHYDKLGQAVDAIATMVTAINNKQAPAFEYQEIQTTLTQWMQDALSEKPEPSPTASDDIASLLSFDSELGDFGNIDDILGDLVPTKASVASSTSSSSPVTTTPSQTSRRASRHGSVLAALAQSMLPDDYTEDDVDHSIKDIFIEEAVDIFDKMPQIIERWIIAGGSDNEDVALIKRDLHTLKGSARMAGYQRFAHVIHNIETAMDTGWPNLDPEDLPELVQLVMDSMVQEVEHLQNPVAASGMVQLALMPIETYLTTSMEHDPSVAPAAVEKAIPEDSVGVSIEAVHAPVVGSQPTAGSDLPIGFKDRMSQANLNSDEESIAGVLRVPTLKVDALSNQLGKTGMVQLQVESSVINMEQQIHEMTANLDRLRRLLKDVEIQAETQMQSRMAEAQKEGSSFDPLEFDRFTRLQELTRMTAEAMNDINNSQTEIVRNLVDVQDAMAENANIADDMQHTVMSVRTVPVSSMKRRLDRLVRQACRETNKQADLVLENELDIDSGVLNKVIAPLEHLVRNAIAHGIEAPSKRLEIGKSDVGTVSLEVNLRGNDIVFQLRDDGDGINREAVQRKAREKGLLGPDETITQEKANTLIFDPGFSTADTISTLAGRGVGMDVVQSEIAAMGGRINVHSESGKGTRFELIVPSYMSVISMVPVRSNTMSYAVPATLVEDVVVVRDILIEEAYTTGELNQNGKTLPFYGLSEVTGHGRNDIVRNNRVLLVTDNNETVAVHIDTLDADRNLVMKPLCRTIATLPGLMGSTVSGDGTPLLVINPVSLRHSVQRTVIQEALLFDTEVKAKTRADITVLVVDDSLTVRRITQKFLLREGFQCILAKDGLDAIEKISEHGVPSIILSDIEMPNMDGFQFVEHVRTTVSKEVPIIMISSRSIEKYEAHARALGVNKSIGKPYQEPELLASIEVLTGLIEKESV